MNKIRQLHEIIIIFKTIQIKHENDIACDTCFIIKSKKYKNHKYNNLTKQILKFVAIDVCESLFKTFEKYRYFLQIVDHYSDRVIIVFIKSRSHAAEHLEK